MNADELALTAFVFLRQGEEAEAAALLARCEARIEEGCNSFGQSCPEIVLIGDRKAYEALRDYQSPVFKQVRDAFMAALGEEDFTLVPRFAVSVANGWTTKAPPLPAGGVIEAEYAEVD